MNFLHTTFTSILDEVNFNQELLNTIKLLTDNKIEFVDILFGAAWGNAYRNWTPHRIKTADIKLEIDKAQDLKVGKFGDDDLFIIIPQLEIEILFCHERDIHLSFNTFSPLVNEMAKLWETKSIVQKQQPDNGN
jgi:hypothetical protein